MRTVGQHNTADLTAVMGATGSGKSLFVKSELRRLQPQRLMVWDFKREYADVAPPVATLADVLRLAYAPRFKIVFQPLHDPKICRDQFDKFCRIAFAAKRLTLVAEELAFVTHAGYAPPGWMMISLAARSEGLQIYGTSQRPAKLDKDFFANASRVRTGRLNFRRDIEVLADALQVSREQVSALKPLEFIERDMNTSRTIRGIVKIPR